MNYAKLILLLTAATVTALSAAQDPAAETPLPTETSQSVIQKMRDARQELGLDMFHDFQVKDELKDELGLIHVRLRQTYKGLRVWGGQAIVHLGPSGQAGPITDALVRGIGLETTPNLGPAEALAVAQNRVMPVGAYADPPAAELVIWPEPRKDDGPSDGEPEARPPTPVREHLAYHVHVQLENGKEETRHEDLLVDAHTGAVLKTWSTLFTAKRKHRPSPRGLPAEGVGNSQYSGKVTLATSRLRGTYELRDPTRGGFSTRNLGGESEGPGEPYVNETTTWGDGQNYDPGRGPTSPNGQTAAVDAHFGLQTTWDFYKNVLGRDGIDGKGTGPTNLVHYASGFDNAFWSDDCFCMTYGDGSLAKTLTSLDVVGHEVSHGLCNATAELGYEGESGGLNESNSDIFGVLIRHYARAAKGEGDHVPDEGANWTVGGEVTAKPFRYMNKPSLDGESPDEWSADLGDLDVHNSSGPMNRAFYFLAQGASPDPQNPAHSRRLPGGMRGIGNDKAIRIWWRTLSTRLTPTSGYKKARVGALQSARELYGKGSREEKAVADAFLAINVGKRTR